MKYLSGGLYFLISYFLLLIVFPQQSSSHINKNILDVIYAFVFSYIYLVPLVISAGFFLHITKILRFFSSKECNAAREQKIREKLHSLLLAAEVPSFCVDEKENILTIADRVKLLDSGNPLDGIALDIKHPKMKRNFFIRKFLE
jgi:hypothetical protein